MEKQGRHHRFLRPGRRLWVGLGVLVALVIGFRAALPHLLHRYVNHTLDRLADYDGRVGEIDVHLARGAYSIHEVELVKATGGAPLPFFAAKRVDLAVDWSELLNGAVVGEMFLVSPQLNFLHGETDQESQTEIDRSWLGIVEDLFPFRINKAEIHNGKLRYRNESTAPRIDVSVTDLAAICTNLTNARNITEKWPARLLMRGRAMGGDMKLEIRFAPLARLPSFDLNLAMDRLDLTEVNDFFLAYAGFDFEAGTLRLFMEVVVENGQFDGYVKPLLEGIKIVDLTDGKNPLQHMWEMLAAGLAHLFKNQPHNRLGTSAPLSGSFNNPQADLWATIRNVFRNAFIEVFRPQLERTVGEDALPPGGRSASEADAPPAR